MRSITKLFAAFGNLADSMLALANVVDAITAKLRLQLAQETDLPALGPPVGEIVEQERTGATESEVLAPKRNGKAKAS